MKTHRFRSYWHPLEAENVCNFLDDLKQIIWQEYGDEIEQIHHELQLREEEISKQQEDDDEGFDDDIPF